ncbi:MAG: hypothetical protein E4H43_00480 [Bacteroidia bacterium]|nr:MAG: hypothetical protein E4H43_00480 [Bacteroidia bacterium]
MSQAGSIIRNREKISIAVAEASSLLSHIKDMIGAASSCELAGCFRISDACLAHLLYLEAISNYIGKNGRSRGSYIITHDEKPVLPDIISPCLNIDLCMYDTEVEKNIQEVKYRKGKVEINYIRVKEIPLQNLWFEKIWKDYLEDKYIES